MRARKQGLCISVLAGVVGLAASSDAWGLVGIDHSGKVFEIDEGTGQGHVIGSCGFVGTNSLARGGSGVLYSFSSVYWDPHLITIDPSTGRGSAGPAPSPFWLYDIRALAFSPENILYAIYRQTASPWQCVLYTIDPRTGQAMQIGQTGTSFNLIQGLVFSPQGVLYGSDIRAGLVVIDTSTGLATQVNPSAGSEGMQSLAFTPDGTLYGASQSALYRINPATGVATLVGSGGYYDLRGLEYVPEPATGALAVLAGLAVMRRRYPWARSAR